MPTFSDITEIESYKEQLQRRLQETEAFIKAEADEIKQQKAAKSEQSKEATEATTTQEVDSTNDNKK